MADPFPTLGTHLGRLYTGIGVGSQANWTSSYGRGNSLTEVAYFRYNPKEFSGSTSSDIMLEAKRQMLMHLRRQSNLGGLITAKTHRLGAFEYGRVTPSQINVQIVKPGLCKITVNFAGSESLPTSVSSDTVMIYTAGAVNTYGFPSTRLINDVGGDPSNFDLSFYQDGNALPRKPFTRQIIRWEPTVIQTRGPWEQWADKVGHINDNESFNVPFGPDGEIRTYGYGRVRFDGFSTQYMPGVESDGGVAYLTKFQFSICSTQWVQQAVEVTTETNPNPDAPGQPAEETFGRIIYEYQYPFATMPYLYN
mgnify:CR=1 FL=1